MVFLKLDDQKFPHRKPEPQSNNTMGNLLRPYNIQSLYTPVPWSTVTVAYLLGRKAWPDKGISQWVRCYSENSSSVPVMVYSVWRSKNTPQGQNLTKKFLQIISTLLWLNCWFSISLFNAKNAIFGGSCISIDLKKYKH